MENIQADRISDGNKIISIPTIKAGGENNNQLLIYKHNIAENFHEKIMCKTDIDLGKTENIQISGCNIESFKFLEKFTSLKRIGFLADTSDVWQSLRGTDKIISLRLHNLKQGKRYLDSTEFLSTFFNLKYLYVHMLGISSLPEVSKLKELSVVFGSFRNENEKAKPFDFSSFRDARSLKIFDGWMAVDRHKIAAEAFIPILENKSLESFGYTQMYETENKKLSSLIEKYCPQIKETCLNYNELMKILREEFL